MRATQASMSQLTITGLNERKTGDMPSTNRKHWGRGVFGRDRATRELQALLANAPATKELHPVESAALAIGAGSAQQDDTASARKVGRKLRKARTAEARYRVASARVTEYRSSEQAQAMVASESARTTRAQAAADKPVDPERPQIARWSVSGAEIIFAFAEVTFYYTLFTYGVPKNASAVSNLSHLVLACLVPVCSLLIARSFAGAVHKVRDSNSEEKRGALWGWLAVKAVGLIVAAVVTFGLVHFRIDAQSATAVTLMGSPPPTLIATSFVATLIAIAATRAWLFPPSEHTTAEARRRNRTARHRHNHLRRKQIRALTKWQNAHLTLALLVARCLNATDQSVLAASTLVQLNRGSSPSNVSSVVGVGQPLPYLSQETASLASTSLASARQLDVEQLTLPLRVLSIAVAYLKAHEPPEHLQHPAVADHIRAEVSTDDSADLGDGPWRDVATPKIREIGS